MRQIFLDTETTGLNPAQGHRIIEIAAVEVVNRRLTRNHFHVYLNPDRDIDPGAQEVHGITLEFLQDKPRFSDIASEFLEFVSGAELVIHNAAFDMGFLNRELALSTGQAVDAAQALAAFEALPLTRQLPWINGLLVDTVRSAGREAANASGADKVAAYDRAYRAIETVFPSEGRPEADLSLASAQVKTLQSAGITFMVPGGAVDAGRLSGNSALANVQGVVTVAGGDIASISRDDFTVNRSRVFTLTEGDILLWSSQGSIDAGRGAKTVVGAPAPVLRLDRATGRLYLDTSGSFTGSGIAVLSEGSDLDLYAPAGAIDAGEAGIRARGNVYLGAQVIHNAVEFNVGGSVSGASLAAPTVGATVSMANAAGTAANTTASNPDDEDAHRQINALSASATIQRAGLGDALIELGEAEDDQGTVAEGEAGELDRRYVEGLEQVGHRGHQPPPT